jgi:hypothetical protein
MDMTTLTAFGRLMDDQQLSEIFLRAGGLRWHFKREAGACEAPAPAAAPLTVTSPAVGCLLLRDAPDAAARYEKDEVIAFVAVGLIRQPVTAPAPGAIGSLLAEPGALVDVGRPLFTFIPA